MKLPIAITASALLATTLCAEPAITIYNQNFAVVRDSVPLDLQVGTNQVTFSGMTAQAETDSVILRDPDSKVALQILEQAYRNDPVSQELMLSLNEGKTIDFYVREDNKPDRTIQGKIIRSGYGSGGQNRTQPVIEVEGKIQFGLPGQPIFPALGDDTILNPTLSWTLNSDSAAKFDAEIAYLTGGMSWKSDYNIVATEDSDLVDLVGWITFNNQSGASFDNATVKLMAGDVNRVQPQNHRRREGRVMAMAAMAEDSVVTEKSFDEFHLYTLGRKVTLRDKETKQVEFIRATDVKAPKIYVYDGIAHSYDQWPHYRGNNRFNGAVNKKVWVLREFKNSKENNLGMALPKGRLRFYQQDEDRQLEFIGENNIDHTPKNETITVYTGNAFDIVGERRTVDFKVDTSNKVLTESFEIKLRNHKETPVEVRVIEHLSRYANWELIEKSDEFTKKDATTIEFRITVQPDEEKVLTYKARYTW